MYSTKYLCTIVFAAMTFFTFGQQEIIEKTIEKEVTVNVQDGIKTIRIVKSSEGDEEVIEWKGGVDEELPKGIEREMDDVDIIEDEEVPDQKKIHQWEGTIGEEELPDDIQKILDDHNIDLEKELEENRGKKKVKIMKIIDEDGNEQILEWDGNGDMPKEMKKREHDHMRKHKSMEYGKRGGRGDKYKGRGYNHKYGKKAKLGIEIEETTAGVVVNDVMDGSGAQKAGIQPGDIITVVDDTSIDSLDRLYAELATHDPGDTIKVKVSRGSSSKRMSVTLK